LVATCRRLGARLSRWDSPSGGGAFLYDPAPIAGRKELGTRSDLALWGDAYTGDFDLPKAATFDLDGTLLDSVDLHAIAWHEAMVKFGHGAIFGFMRLLIRPTHRE
jgi:hypothetical protein